jgi:hypothetical protein
MEELKDWEKTGKKSISLKAELTGVSLKDISSRVKESIIKIGSEVDLFKV